MQKTALHYGGGALGRGLVIPLLVKSGYEVILADVDTKLLEEIKKSGGYYLNVTDTNKKEFIPVTDIVSSIENSEKLNYYINNNEIITTAVGRDNLKYVMQTIINGKDNLKEQWIICAENIENVNAVMKSIIHQYISQVKKSEFVSKIIIPNTVVDRICSSNWPNDLTIDTEKYGELSIDANTAGNINVKEIPSIDNIEAAFMRKRLLLNTFADASAFMALSTNKKYLSEAIIDEEIQRKLTPYFQSFDLLLVENYNYTQKEVNYWKELYRSRLSNSKINRNLDTVARNLWEKLTLEERFIFPLVELYKKGEKIDESIHVIVQMIKIYTDIEPYQIFEKLKKLWRGNEAGEEMLKITKHYLDV